VGRWADHRTVGGDVRGTVSLGRTEEELSVVCAEGAVPQGVTCEKGWWCLQIRGPLAFSESGVISLLAIPLTRYRHRHLRGVHVGGR
jgi:hypothetical protein